MPSDNTKLGKNLAPSEQLERFGEMLPQRFWAQEVTMDWTGDTYNPYKYDWLVNNTAVVDTRVSSGNITPDQRRYEMLWDDSTETAGDKTEKKKESEPQNKNEGVSQRTIGIAVGAGVAGIALSRLLD